ncbi:MAG: hydratase [Clostridia bacterium]|nr:hydratase [Clostridia bacterium]
MIKLYENGVYILPDNDFAVIEDTPEAQAKLASLGKNTDKTSAKKNTIAYGILTSHNTSDDENNLKIKFDAIASHDITYVGIIQTARASGLEKFPLPYVLTNCHNSLCAVGGTINEDDHVFGLSAAKKYGGIYVPAHQAVIHSFMREMMSGCGKMILGSDSHTRYGALGTMAIGEGGGELVKQLLSRTYDVKMPGVVAVKLDGTPKKGVGPQDVALAIIGAVFKNGYVKNRVLEFIGSGIANLPIEYRNGIDVMTTETTCLSSIWMTDDITRAYFENHKRPSEYKKLAPGSVAYYDGLVEVDLSRVEPMIALPFHPSNTYTVRELCDNAHDILAKVEADALAQLETPGLKLGLCDKITKDGIRVDQGVIAGCAGGTYDNLTAASDILRGTSIGSGEFALSVYPASQPVFLELMRDGAAAELMSAGATLRSAFCGPCFGAGDVPANGGLSIRHSTRNFPNREGSKPSNGQLSSVALMDARSIAATAMRGGILTPATEIEYDERVHEYKFDDSAYNSRIYNGFGKADSNSELKFGPNITDWPKMKALTDDVMLKVVSVITDPVTTTDELIPSGETSSYRSNPLKLAEFTLSRKDPEYVKRAKAVKELEDDREFGVSDETMLEVYDKLKAAGVSVAPNNTAVGSTIYALKPGDGSAREQAASCQKVLGGLANIAGEYATKRYRSNLINWGMLPFVTEEKDLWNVGDHVFVPAIRDAIVNKADKIKAYVVSDTVREITLSLGELTDDERKIILSGCLINYYRDGN